MNRQGVTFRHEFVEYLPAKLEPEVLYVSMPYATSAHRCACGCGHEVVTPLSPTDWQIFFDGVAVSLTPSIGNWALPCRSHYFIRYNEVQWAGQWSLEEIEAGRVSDRGAKERYFNAAPNGEPERKGLWQRFRDRILRL